VVCPMSVILKPRKWMPGPRIGSKTFRKKKLKFRLVFGVSDQRFVLLCIPSHTRYTTIIGKVITIIIIIIIFLHGLGRLTCSGIDALPSFPRASTISSSSRFVVEGVFRKSGGVCSFKMVDTVLFVFGSHVLYSRDL